MGEVMTDDHKRFLAPFNGPVEIGLRALVILNEMFPASCPLQSLVVFDYLIVHSDDLPGGPPGLHPKSPHRSGELLVRRNALQRGLMLFSSRGLIHRHYDPQGIMYEATEYAGGYLDALNSSYSYDLRERAKWLIGHFGSLSDSELNILVREHIDEWGAEFELESILWSEEEA